MNNLPFFELNTNWRYFPTEDTDVAFGASQTDHSAWGALPFLGDWPGDLIATRGTLHLTRKVSLAAADVCVRFWLRLETAPEQTEVFINGWQLGITRLDTAFEADVTDYVTLENNLILLKVKHKGAFGRALLRALPCEE